MWPRNFLALTLMQITAACHINKDISESSKSKKEQDEIARKYPADTHNDFVVVILRSGEARSIFSLWLQSKEGFVMNGDGKACKPTYSENLELPREITNPSLVTTKMGFFVCGADKKCLAWSKKPSFWERPPYVDVDNTKGAPPPESDKRIVMTRNIQPIVPKAPVDPKASKVFAFVPAKAGETKSSLWLGYGASPFVPQVNPIPLLKWMNGSFPVEGIVDNTCLVAIGQKVYVFGGTGPEGKAVKTYYAGNAEAIVPQQLGLKKFELPQARSNAGCAVDFLKVDLKDNSSKVSNYQNALLYLVGGKDENGNLLTDMLVADASNGGWLDVGSPKLGKGLHHVIVAVLSYIKIERAYIIGCESPDCGSVTVYKIVKASKDGKLHISLENKAALEQLTTLKDSSFALVPSVNFLTCTSGVSKGNSRHKLDPLALVVLLAIHLGIVWTERI